jgi:hypothetical protein
VKELDIREWGDCPLLEDNVGENPGENYEKRIKAEEEAKKESEKNTLMNDAIFGDGDDESDGTYDDSEDSEVEEWSDDEEVEEGEIGSDELDFLGPLQPFSHDNCIGSRCENANHMAFMKAGRDFGTDKSTPKASH